MKVAVIAPRGEAPVAVLGEPTWQARGKAIWAGHWRAHKAWLTAARLLGADESATFDAVLSRRWGCLVACTREFSQAWCRRRGRPAPSFFLEVVGT